MLFFVSYAAMQGGCGWLASPPTVWLASDMVHLTDHTEPVEDTEVFDPATATLKTFAAANETVSFQIVIDAGPQGASGVQIAFEPLLAGPDKIIAAENIRAFRAWPIRINSYPPWYLRLAEDVPTPASFYDPLTSVDDERLGQPFTIDGADRLVLWVDLSVPRQTLPENYTGRFTVTSGLQTVFSGTIQLKVYDFVLPDTRPIAAIGGFDHRTLFSAFLQQDGQPYVPVHLERTKPEVRSGLVLMRQLMCLAHEHRLDLFDSRIHPVLKRDLQGRVQLDWDDYDAIVMPYLTGSAFADRLGNAAWALPVCQDWPDPNSYHGANSVGYAETLQKVLADCREHFADTPELAKQLFFWPYRGNVNGEAYTRHLHLAERIRTEMGDAPILTHLPVNPPEPTGWMAPTGFAASADIFAPQAQWLNPAEAARLKDPDKPLAGMWLVPGMPPYLPSLSVLATAADVRALPWFAMKYRCAGLFLPNVLNGSEGGLRAMDDEVGFALTGDRAAIDTPLFYPGSLLGSQQVLPSVRLKRLRRGLQDLAYLSLLDQRQRMGVAMAVVNAMVRYAGRQATGDHYLDVRLGGWIKQGPLWRVARQILAREVVSAIHPEVLSEHQVLSERLAWRNFDEKVHTITVEKVRCEVRPVKNVSATEETQELPPRLRATVILDLYNEYSRNVDLTAKIDKLPAGWQAIQTVQTLAPMLPARRQTLVLTAETVNPPLSSHGKMPLPISLIRDLTHRKVVTAPVAFLRSSRPSEPICIDGQLDDWPMRLGNTAGSFTLIGQRGRVGDGLAHRQTLAFVLNDDENLYIAIRCNEPQIDSLMARADNQVRYAQLMACGEDLVEILLDPGGKAQKASQLYHIVVKANGVLLAERGVGCQPPLGTVQPWSAAASVAVSRQKDVWIVELAIPRSAFGSAGKESFWGINFTRFATQQSEASSWSGAPRYFYDPASLGTLLLTPRTLQESVLHVR